MMPQVVPIAWSPIMKPKHDARDNSPCRPEKYTAMPKCQPKYQATDTTTCGKRIEKSMIIIHAEKFSFSPLHTTVLRLPTDLDNITLDVADFEELGVATILNRPGEHAMALELLVPFL